jgi:hypothetical protein
MSAVFCAGAKAGVEIELVEGHPLRSGRMQAAVGSSPRRFFCVHSVPAFGRDLIDKLLGDRLAEKQGSK